MKSHKIGCMVYRLSHREREVARRGLAEARRELAEAEAPAPASPPAGELKLDQWLPYRDSE